MNRILISFLLIFMISESFYAHKENVAIVHNIKITQTEAHWFYHYELINIHNIGLK